jgi:signal transduction histidine kinase
MTSVEERLLVFTALPVDASLVCRVAGQAGIAARSCAAVDELCAEIRAGAGMAVIGQEALTRAVFDQLVTALQELPPWSDFPLILIAVPDADSAILEAAVELFNVVVLPRPVPMATLVTSLWASLRARQRQYELRSYQEAMQQALTRERARAAELEAIMQAVPAATFLARDPECREMIGSQMTYELLRLPPGSNLSKSLDGKSPTNFRAMIGGEEIPPDHLPAQRAAATGQAVRNYEFELVFEDGTRRNLLGDAVPLIGEDGRPCGAAGAFLDITERKQTEERLRQSQKLETLGLLAGGIAHDFNNLLTTIVGNATMVLEDVGSGAAEQLKEIITSADRAAQRTRQLLAYSGKGGSIVRDLDIAQAVNEMSDVAQFSIPKGVELSVNLNKRLPLVRMDPSQFQQILLNLVINAGEAIGESHTGTITISTSMADVQEPFADALGQTAAPGRYVYIEVSDTGCGIDEQAKLKIFDPFFTTKFLGRGLGLAAVAGIIRALKGAITLESAPRRGTVFRVFFPASDVKPDSRASKIPVGERGSVLVVDDEPGVRAFLAAALRRAGYRILTACDGRGALAVCAHETRSIDAAVLDIVTPLIGADELLAELRTRYPQIRVLLTSGYSESESRRICAAFSDVAFLQKPCTTQQVTTAIADLIGCG